MKRFGIMIAWAAALWGLTAVPLSAANKVAGKLEINAWEFDRGNARVSENPGIYGDFRDKHPELMLTAGDTLPWVAEYDIEFPVDATYTLRVRYASAGVYPADILLDNKPVGKCCLKMTCNAPPYPDRKNPALTEGLPERTWDKHGAEWETSCEIPITAGKHTLKLTRNGPPPNPITLSLESPVAFPKDWKAPQRKLDLSRIPVRYRNVFLPADAVNTEALRLAIKDTVKTFGPQYAQGPQYLTELADLEKKQLQAAGGSTNDQQTADTALKSLRRRAMLNHPALKFDKLLFLRQKYAGASTYTGHLNRIDAGGNLCVLSPVSADGKVTPLVPELTNGVFGRFDLSFDADKVIFCYAAKDKSYRIYEIDIDPKTGQRVAGKSLRQITRGGADEDEAIRCSKGICGNGYDDIDPVYLPNGKLMFASTRSQRQVLCFPATVTSLHVMDADGGNITCISQGQVNETSPCVLDDGRVVYMRWEYVDKGFANVQSLWAVRPDGSGSDHVYKNNVICPAAMMHARSIPGSRRIVTTAAGHHGGQHGPIVLIDNRRHRNTADAMENLTPEVRYPGMYGMPRSIGYFREPYPFSETFFLVSHQPGPGGVEYGPGAELGIYALDAWGNRAELYRDATMSCLQPMPLLPRRRPTDVTPVTAAAAKESPKLATMFLNDVYQGLPGIERGRVKYIRVMEAMNLTWEDCVKAPEGDSAGQQALAVSLQGDVARKYIHGIATVYEDGSAFFTVPANKNLFFQALDENYMELHRMRTFINLMPGENRSCVGCHEFRRKAPNLRDTTRPLAMAHGVKALYPQPGDAGPRAVHYPLDVQPIMNKRCVSCHGDDAPKGGLSLTGELTTLWNRSYENLLNKGFVSYLQTCSYGSSYVPLEQPLSFGSHRSKLVERIGKDPCKAGLTKEEFIKIVTWIDANAPFYGTHDGKKNLKWKNEPDFRPLPLAGK
jgi:hypothetical protein